MYMWSALKEKCPLDITDLTEIGEELESHISLVVREKRPIKSIFIYKSKLNILIRHLLSLFAETNGSKADKMLIYDFQQNYARLLKRLDEMEDISTNTTKTTDNYLYLYISELQSILYGDIFNPIKKASEIYPDDKKKFIYKVYELVNNNVGIFGAESRFRGTKKGAIATTEIPPVSAEEMVSKEGQERLENKYDKSFGFEELKKIGKNK